MFQNRASCKISKFVGTGPFRLLIRLNSEVHLGIFFLDF